MNTRFPSAPIPVDTAVLDIDGTLVYAHVWSWHQAFRLAGIDVPTWRIHRAIGMGGDRLVAAMTSLTVEEVMGDAIRSERAHQYEVLSRKVDPTPGARELLVRLRERGLKVVLASSGSRDDTTDAITLLRADHLIDGYVYGDDVQHSNRATDSVERTIAVVQGRRGLVVGDSVWEMRAAVEAEFSAVGLLTGGVSALELHENGAASVFRDPAELTATLDEVMAGCMTV